MKPYYPVCLDIKDKRCLVVGGGEVALRKVRALLDCEAKVMVVSPETCPDLAKLAAAGKITFVLRPFQAADLDGAKLAIAATSDASTNREVAAEARRRGILVNVVDDASESDFIVPSWLRRGDITIAVSSSGASPALARKIRSRLDAGFGAEYAELARIVGQVRDELKRRGIRPSPDQWQSALDLDELADRLRRGESQRVRERLLANLEVVSHSSIG